jgi:hypothetical protein
MKAIKCPNCDEEQPKIRKPKNWRQFLWGGNTCAKCGTEMDSSGNEVKPKK